MAELHMPTAAWLWEKISFAAVDQIHWCCCVSCNVGLPLAPNERPHCHTRSQWTPAHGLWKTQACPGPSVLLPQELQDAVWAAFRLQGPEGAVTVYEHIWWSIATQQWETLGRWETPE